LKLVIFLRDIIVFEVLDIFITNILGVIPSDVNPGFAILEKL